MCSTLINNVRKFTAPNNVREALKEELFCVVYERAEVNVHPYQWAQYAITVSKEEMFCLFAEMAKGFARNEMYTPGGYGRGENMTGCEAMEIFVKSDFEQVNMSAPQIEGTMRPSDNAMNYARYVNDNAGGRIFNAMSLEDVRTDIADPLFWLLTRSTYVKGLSDGQRIN